MSTNNSPWDDLQSVPFPSAPTQEHAVPAWGATTAAPAPAPFHLPPMGRPQQAAPQHAPTGQHGWTQQPEQAQPAHGMHPQQFAQQVQQHVRQHAAPMHHPHHIGQSAQQTGLVHPGMPSTPVQVVRHQPEWKPRPSGAHAHQSPRRDGVFALAATLLVLTILLSAIVAKERGVSYAKPAASSASSSSTPAAAASPPPAPAEAASSTETPDTSAAFGEG